MKAKSTKPYSKRQFIADVTKEVKALKKHATKEELQNLDFNEFDPDKKEQCIYGQITGYCQSKRASELIFNCCVRFVRNDLEIDDKGFEAIKEAVNGAFVGRKKSLRSLINNRNKHCKFNNWGLNTEIGHLSAIESYILLPEANNKNLISFLKGNTNKLVL